MNPKGFKSKELPGLLTRGDPRGELVFWSFPALTDHLRSLAHGPLPPSPKVMAPVSPSATLVPPSLAFMPHCIMTSRTILRPRWLIQDNLKILDSVNHNWEVPVPYSVVFTVWGIPMKLSLGSHYSSYHSDSFQGTDKSNECPLPTKKKKNRTN